MKFYLKDFLIFITVAETRSLSISAKQLGLSVSAVSKRLTRLESYLKVSLLERDTRKINLTNPGKIAYDKSKLMTAEFSTFIDEIRNYDFSEINFHIPTMLSEFYVGQWAFDFFEKNNNIAVHVEPYNKEHIHFSGFDDVTFKFGAIEDETLVHRALKPMRKIICAAPSYLAKAGDISLDSLPRQKVVFFSEQSPENVTERLRAGEESFFAKVKPSSFYSGNLLNILNIILKGKAIGHGIPDFIAQPYIDRGELVPIFTEYQLPFINAYLIWKYRRYDNHNLKSFVDFIEGEWNSLVGSPANNCCEKSLHIK